MLKNLFTAAFIIVFTLFALDYFKILPSDKTLAFNNISSYQERTINNFDAIPEHSKQNTFTHRVVNNNKNN